MEKKLKFYKPNHLLYKKIGEDIWGKYTANIQNKTPKLRKKLILFANNLAGADEGQLTKVATEHIQHVPIQSEINMSENEMTKLNFTKYTLNKTQAQLKTLATKEKLHLFRIDIKSPKPRKIIKSTYRKILEEKQKIKAFYGELSHKQLARIFILAKKLGGDHIQNFFALLESRVDMILFRANLVNSLAEARQLLSHGFIFINEHKIKRPNYIVSTNDVISINSIMLKKQLQKLHLRLRQNRILCHLPDYLEVNYNLGKLMLAYKPQFNDIFYPVRINPTLVPAFFK